MTSPRGRKKLAARIALIALIVILLLFGVLFLFQTRTHDSYKIMSTEEKDMESDGKYARLGDRLIRYTDNSILEMDLKGKERWSFAYEMTDPVLSMSEETTGVADLGGNQIYLFDRDGYLGTVETAMPVQEISVAGHGIVAAVLRDDEKTMVMCYNADGTVLVEGKATLTEYGYPLTIALSEDAHKLFISYVTMGITVDSTVRVYNLEDAKASASEKLEFEETYQDELIPTILFLTEENPVAVGTGRILFFSCTDQVELIKQVEVSGKIASVLKSEELLGVVTQGTGNVMTQYDKSGRKVRNFSLGMNYSFIEFEEKQVILMNGRSCMIYSESGKESFSGELESEVSYILPMSGVNRYLFLGPESVQTVELKK